MDRVNFALTFQCLGCGGGGGCIGATFCRTGRFEDIKRRDGGQVWHGFVGVHLNV